MCALFHDLFLNTESTAAELPIQILSYSALAGGGGWLDMNLACAHYNHGLVTYRLPWFNMSKNTWSARMKMRFAKAIQMCNFQIMREY